MCKDILFYVTGPESKDFDCLIHGDKLWFFVGKLSNFIDFGLNRFKIGMFFTHPSVEFV